MNTIYASLNWLVIAGGGVLAIVIFIVLFIIFRKKKKDDVIDIQVDETQWVEALGNIENINAVTVRGSRLSVELKNDKNINRDKLTELGVKSIITMSNKIILVIENNASIIAEQISSRIQNN